MHPEQAMCRSGIHDATGNTEQGIARSSGIYSATCAGEGTRCADLTYAGVA